LGGAEAAPQVAHNTPRTHQLIHDVLKHLGKVLVLFWYQRFDAMVLQPVAQVSLSHRWLSPQQAHRLEPSRFDCCCRGICNVQQLKIWVLGLNGWVCNVSGVRCDAHQVAACFDQCVYSYQQMLLDAAPLSSHQQLGVLVAIHRHHHHERVWWHQVLRSYQLCIAFIDALCSGAGGGGQWQRW
jgi:hypothetical protein